MIKKKLHGNPQNERFCWGPHHARFVKQRSRADTSVKLDDVRFGSQWYAHATQPGRVPGLTQWFALPVIDCVSAHSRCTALSYSFHFTTRAFRTMAEVSSTDRDSNGSWEENSIISEGFSDYSDSLSSRSSSSDISDDEVNNEEVEIVT